VSAQTREMYELAHHSPMPEALPLLNGPKNGDPRDGKIDKQEQAMGNTNHVQPVVYKIEF
jgi:hypothetical protein